VARLCAGASQRPRLAGALAARRRAARRAPPCPLGRSAAGASRAAAARRRRAAPDGRREPPADLRAACGVRASAARGAALVARRRDQNPTKSRPA
jgi:hypothetical protein